MLSRETSSIPATSRGYSNILVGYDGSKNSERALARAKSLAAECGAKLSVLVAVNTTQLAFAPMAPSAPEEVFESLIEDGKKVLAQAIESVGPFVPPVSGSVEEGNAAECILDFAARNGVDLIVLGRRGISSVERFLLGGVSSNVVGHSKCDVLIVK